MGRQTNRATSRPAPPKARTRAQCAVYGAGWTPAGLARQLRIRRGAIDMTLRGKSRNGLTQLRIAVLIGRDPRDVFGEHLAPGLDAMLDHDGNVIVTDAETQTVAGLCSA